MLVSVSAKIALVTLTKLSESGPQQTKELVEEIRQVLQSSSLSKTWSIEKITILDETEPTVKVFPTRRVDDVTAQ